MDNHPTLDQFIQKRARTTWKDEHRGVPYSVAFWDYRDGTDDIFPEVPHGTWNFYITLREPQWKPEDFERMLTVEREDTLVPKNGRKVWHYGESMLYNLDWPGGMTFYEVYNEAPWRAIRAGCDYNHSWDRDEGYPAHLPSVEFDAKELIDELLTVFTPLLRCNWSGRYAPAEEMLETVHGSYVHRSAKDRVPPKWFGE